MSIKVLVVEDSDIIADVIAQTLESDSKIKVIGQASNGLIALEKLKTLSPDLITLDVWMPIMDGFETVERIMAVKPTPILVVTSSSLKEDVHLSMRMLAAGALDIMEKPNMRDDAQWAKHQKELIAKVKMLSKVKVITHLRGKSLQALEPSAPPKIKTETVVAPGKKPEIKEQKEVAPKVPPLVPNTPFLSGVRAKFPATSHFQVLAITSSTGGPSALQKIFQSLPTNFPASILVVQHISDGFTQGLVDWLQRESPLKIKIAKDNELPLPGVVYFAPDKRDLHIDPAMRFVTKPGSQMLCPSGDVTLQAVAKMYGNRAVGIVLTGMGNDGAQGLKEIKLAGGYTISQDEATSLIFGMPKAAFDLMRPNEVLAISSIAPRLVQLFQETPETWQSKLREV
jgi:two-component system, chemotaxis family, protein-glutamate methylesterase/glutaminase